MSSRVVGLGHVGIYVRDLPKMTSFYRDFMGMTLTKARDTSSFLSWDPESCDHEIALIAGRPSLEDPHLINQISLRVETLDDVRDFHRRIKAADNLEMVRLVTHVSAIGCYFLDPEGNTTEVFWLTGLPSWVNISVPIDIDRPDAEIMDEIRGYWEKVRHVQVGEIPRRRDSGRDRRVGQERRHSSPLIVRKRQG